MRAMIVIAVAITMMATVSFAQGCSPAGTTCALVSADVATSSSQVCDSNYWLGAIARATSGTSLNAVYQQFTACTKHNAGSGVNNHCCPDPCQNHTGTIECTKDKNCAALPVHSNGQSGASGPSTCVRQDKLCALLSNSQCEDYGFCYMNNGNCEFIIPTSNGRAAATLAPGDSVQDKCGSLHPMVIAMLVLMFVTLVGAIIIVGVIVVINQRKADEEDAAAEAAAKGRRGHM